jgi:amino acid permease
VIRDMKNKDDFGMVIGIVYGLVGSLYLILGVLGYIMFGDLTQPEIFANLIDGKFTRWLACLTVILLSLNPLAKYPVILGPVNRAVERVLGVGSKWLPTRYGCIDI